MLFVVRGEWAVAGFEVVAGVVFLELEVEFEYFWFRDAGVLGGDEFYEFVDEDEGGV